MEKDRIIDLVRIQKNCEFSLRFILQRADNLWKTYFTMLKLVKKGTRNTINYDYGDWVLGETILDLEQGLKLFQDSYQKGSEKGKFAVPSYDEFPIENAPSFMFAPSKSRHGIVKDDWPLRLAQLRVDPNRMTQDWSRELLRENLPYYPNLSEAVIHFFDLAVENFSSSGEIYVLVPDYRARIDSLKLALSKGTARICSPEIEYKDLIVKVFAKSGLRIITLPDIHPDSETVEFDTGFQPDTLDVVLLSRQDNSKIDMKEIAKWRGEEEGIVIERTQEAIVSLARAGESQNLEYKLDVLDEAQKNDFIESVVAFLNTNRGIILVGVDDKGNIIGTKKSAEDIRLSIHDSCDPPPKNVKIEKREVEERNVILVDIPEGDDKPYQSKRDKNWYVRHNANDMKIDR